MANRMVDSARSVLNNYLPDVYIYTDTVKGTEPGKYVQNQSFLFSLNYDIFVMKVSWLRHVLMCSYACSISGGSYIREQGSGTQVFFRVT